MPLDNLLYDSLKKLDNVPCYGCGAPSVSSSITFRCFRDPWEPTPDTYTYLCQECIDIQDWRRQHVPYGGMDWDWIPGEDAWATVLAAIECDWCVRYFGLRDGPISVTHGDITTEKLMELREGNCTCNAWEILDTVMAYAKRYRMQQYAIWKKRRTDVENGEKCYCSRCQFKRAQERSEKDKNESDS